MKLTAILSLVLSLSVSSVLAAPREWTDQATGRKVAGEFVSLDGDQVTLSINGKEYKMPVAKLSADDQAYLKVVGEMPAPAPAAASEAMPAVPAKSTSKVQGPVEVDGSNYYYYVPASLKPGKKVPLIFYTSSGGGSAGTVRKMIEGAELCGWIAACSVESSNSGDQERNPVHSERCVKHLIATQAVDPGQLYFTGNSGGARIAHKNAKNLGAAGVLAIIAGGKEDELSKSRNYFMISGSTDYNRYDTSHSFAEVRKSAALRFHPGPHEDGPDWLITEGIVWLQAAYFEKQKSPAADRVDYESSVTTWIKGLAPKAPERAAWWADFFKTRMTGPSKPEIEKLANEWSVLPANVAYIQGVAELEAFAEAALAPEGPYYKPGHTSSEIQRKADKILQERGDSAWIKEIATAMKNPVVGTRK